MKLLVICVYGKSGGVTFSRNIIYIGLKTVVILVEITQVENELRVTKE